VAVETFPVRLSSANALEILKAWDVVLDGSDNFPTRYLVNDACVFLGKPNVYGAIFRFEGQAAVFDARRGPCYRCLYADPPPPDLVPSCAEGGVLGVLPGIIGSIQALEALKLVLGVGDPLIGRLLLFDALQLSFRELALEKDPACPVCGKNPSVRQLIDYEAFCGVPTGGPPEAEEVSVRAFAAERSSNPRILVLDVREPFEHAIAPFPGARTLPLGQLPARLAELDPKAEIVAVCHHGQRSLTAARLLRGAGFAHARSLAGGIDAWAREVDGNVPRY